MISVQGLTKAFRDRVAISDISFTVNRGEVVGLLGPNGAGKSTTMKILSGILPAQSGTAIINGHDVAKEGRAAKASIGYLPETPPLYLAMEVEPYLDFAAALHGVRKLDRSRAVASAIERCGLGDVRRRIIGNLSKGYRQRVGLAQAIAHNPPVLILDEPTVGLDPKQIIEIRNVIGSFREQHTVVLSTHILSEVQATCSRVVVIDKGRKVAEDTLEALSRRLSPEQRIFVETQNSPPTAILEKLRSLAGVTGLVPIAEGNALRSPQGYSFYISAPVGLEIAPELARILVEGGVGLRQLRPEQMSLEEAFLKIVSGHPKSSEGKHV